MNLKPSGVAWAASFLHVGRSIGDSSMLRTAARAFWRPTSFYLGLLLAAWTAQYVVGALWRGPLDRYAASWLATTPAFLGLVLPYVVTAGGVAWGDYCRDVLQRQVWPIVLLGSVAGLAAFLLRSELYPWAAEALYCGEYASCTTALDPMRDFIRESQALAFASALLAPINAVMGMGIALITLPAQPLMRLRVQRWFLALSVWVVGSLLGSLIASMGVDAAREAWIVVGVPVLIPLAFALGLLGATKRFAHA